MTEKQKKAFLKSEGWDRFPPFNGSPEKYGHPESEYKSGLHYLEAAYRIASRRRRQREARALRKRGYKFCLGSWWRPVIGKYVEMTRQEALQTLEAQP